jgi:hypothetical protein
METQESVKHEPANRLPGGFQLPLARRRTGHRKSLRAEARRRRLVANAVVLGTTGAVVALAAFFNHVLSR